ncbi:MULTISPECIES: molybdopterin-dependent oxidoreductase [unclassified Adlercreutzia]|uniref:molybdopterin-dependent oxidoreductase n=1 Tax=unclassified Adlercreutzia TaxID=2636013 RepID=UPI0013EC14C6|nr:MULTISPECIES: molybdopterin-dependent oxidoreductase [unclassified Adlercreutzia]
MNETKRSSLASATTMSRRGFMKAAAVAGAIGAASGGMFGAGSWFAPTTAHAESEERTFYTFHQTLCTGNCSLKCTMRDGRLCKVEPNDMLDEEYSMCCARGMSEIQHIYGDTRLQTPLRRVGERGEGSFEAITWDEAMKEVGEKLKAVWDQHGKESVYVSLSSEPRFGLLAGLLSASTYVEPGIDIGIGNGLDPATGQSGFYPGTNETRDMVNSKFIMINGHNFAETCMMQARNLLDAIEAGAEVVVVDPHFSTTAGIASKWIPITPGADAAMYLGMISHILDNELYDEEFMRAHSSMPYLVKADGSLLRWHEVSGEAPRQVEDAKTKKVKEFDPFVVWDSKTNGPKVYDDAAAEPALSAPASSGYATVFDQLKESQKAYTLDWASERTGISVDDLAYIAERYASSGASMLGLGMGGSDKYSNADVLGHAVAVLVALTGNIGGPGKAVGSLNGGRGHSASLASWKFPDASMKANTLPMFAYDFRTQENDVHAVISVGNTLQQFFANMNLTAEWLKTLDFVLEIDIYDCESARFADIVLPACTKFECPEEVGDVKCASNHIMTVGRGLDPLFESKTDFQIMLEIARAVGLDDAMPQTAEEWVRYQVDNNTAKALEGVTLDKLQENHGLMPLAGIEKPRIGFADQKYKTESGRLDVYYEKMAKWNQALPTWEECSEIYADNPARAEYPYQITQTRSRFLIHSMFYDAKWMNQYVDAHVEMNPADMAEEGIADGDLVECYNDRGSFKCEVVANEAVRPGSVRTTEGAWSRNMDGGNIQTVTNDWMPDRRVDFMKGGVTPFNDTLVAIRKA